MQLHSVTVVSSLRLSNADWLRSDPVTLEGNTFQVCLITNTDFREVCLYGHEDSRASNWLIRRDINRIRSIQPGGTCELDLILAGALTR